MIRLAAVLTAILLTCLTFSARALDLPGVGADASAYESAIMAKAPPQPVPAQQDAGRRRAADALKAGKTADAVAGFEQVIRNGDQSNRAWLALSDAWTSGNEPKPDRALIAAWLAYRRSDDPAARLRALRRLADLLEGPLNRPRDALHTWQAVASILAEQASPADGGDGSGQGSVQGGDKAAADDRARVNDRITSLRQQIGLEVAIPWVDTGRDPPRLCVRFSDRLKIEPGVRFDDYIKAEPDLPGGPEVADDTLCLTGAAYATDYTVTLRAGLPGAGGLNLRQNQSLRLSVGDRTPTVAFRSDAFILPRGGADGLPMTAVNVNRVKLTVVRVNDRNLVPLQSHDALFQPLDHWTVERLADRDGSQVWTGTAETRGQRNVTGVTPLPMRRLIGEPRPGIYAVYAEPEDPSGYSGDGQWVVVSDLGLTVYKEPDGVTAFVRSYATGKPLAGIPVALLAANNAELVRATTDDQGRVRLAAAMPDHGGERPTMIVAYGADNDLALLDLTRAAFDLSDRGVSGRAPPGPLDAFLYSDRGIYRPGERVNLTALLRDDRTRAVDGFPLTLKVLRPSHSVFYSGVVAAGPQGAHVLPLDLTSTAPLGTWTVNAYADPKGDPIGQMQFQVEEFVPERLAVTATAAAPLAVAGTPLTVTVDGHFLYGPPATGLTGRADAVVEADPAPFPAWPGYRFGLEDEEVTARTTDLTVPALDGQGKADLAVTLPPQPDTTRPLRAHITVAVAEPGGRPSRADLTVPVANQPYVIGIKPDFTGIAVAEGVAPRFTVITLDQAGQPLAKAGLAARLVAEHTDYQWYYENHRFRFRSVVRHSPVKTVTLATAVAAPVPLAFDGLPFGDYRLEIAEPGGKVATSLHFTVGWPETASAADVPDKLQIVADRPAYPAGGTARLFITPPFAGELLVTVATDHVLATRTLSSPAAGTTVELPVGNDWGPGAYVIATVFRPPVAGREHQPIRAVGVAWLGIDAAARSFKVAVEAPDGARPRGAVPVTVRVAAADNGAPAAGAFVTLAAVDEGILHLTDFKTPDPVAWFHGKRRLGVLIRDDYGRLIDPALGDAAELRQGGDQMGAGLPDVPVKVVSLFQGPVALDAQGTARLTLDIPDFDGRLRLMAVAFDHDHVGAAAAPLTLRDPLVAQLTLPRFLAPGDEARATLSIHAVDAPAGHYRVTLTGGGAVAVTDGTFDLDLAAGERRTLTRPLRGLDPGRGTVAVAVTAPDGQVIRHELALTVRSARPVDSNFTVRSLDPGGKVEAGAALLAGYLPGTGSVRLGFSAAPPLDTAGYVQALERYPYGCLEQSVSTALPFLAADRLGVAAAEAAGRVTQGIARVLDKQRYDGSFGLWSAHGETEPWLSAYAIEFLVRARAKGFAVPDEPLRQALEWLRDISRNRNNGAADLVVTAYAHHVLTLAGVPVAGSARVLAELNGKLLPTPLARGQMAAALARAGETERARRLAAAATDALAREPWLTDYGSTVRDAAALIVVLGEVDLLGDRLPRLLDRLPAGDVAARQTNTQEQSWLIQAAAALVKDRTTLTLARDGKPWGRGDPVLLVPASAELAAGVSIANAGRSPVWQSLTVAGVPAQPQPAAREGLRVKRSFFRRDGQPLNLDQVRQNDVFVVVVEGEANTKLTHQALLTHGLPAGWEIENPALSGVDDSLPWLTDVTPARAVEVRDDRFAAAIDLTPDADHFKLAYLVRAVTPGSFELPGAVLEDMYKPRFFARQAVGRITVLPAGE